MSINFFTTSPFSDRADDSKEVTETLCRHYEIELPPVGARHFLSHLDELTPLAIEKAFSLFDQAGISAGAHTFTIDNQFLAVTRLCGPKVGDGSLEKEERQMHYRGKDRPLQPVVIREEPFRETNKVTLIVFPNKNNKLTLWTMHSGDAMPPDFTDNEWKLNALAFRSDEIKSA
tara:strand:- start:20345 stop:20866 length:522 start_codon:yes stop_codon:yes gene_type:complete